MTTLEQTLRDLHALFKEQHGRNATTESEYIVWGREQGLISDDEFGACCMIGMVA